MKKRLVALLMAMTMVMSMAGCGKVDANQAVAQFGDTKITADVADFYARFQQAQYETYYAGFMGDDMWNGEAEAGVSYEESVKESVMDSLQTLYVLDAHKEDYGVSLSKEEQEAIQQTAEAFIEGNESKDLEAISGTTETASKVLELLTVQEKMRIAMTKDVNTDVSDEEAAQKSMQYVYFSYNKISEDGTSTPMTEEEKEALKKEAEAFREESKGQADFVAFAEEKGYTASKLTFDSESDAPSEVLVAAMDKLKSGEVSTVVEDAAGLFVGKLESEFDREATDKKKDVIISERKAEMFEKLCEEWKEEAKIKVNKSVWNKISFVDQGVVIKGNE